MREHCPCTPARPASRTPLSVSIEAVVGLQQLDSVAYDAAFVNGDIATEVIARYAVMGPRMELERTLPLEPGEALIVGVIAYTRFGANPLFRSRRGFVRLSNRRLCVVRHYGFIRDRIIVIPPGAIKAVERRAAAAIDVTFRAREGERVITIVNWRRARGPIDQHLVDGSRVDDMLREIATALAPVKQLRGSVTGVS